MTLTLGIVAGIAYTTLPVTITGMAVATIILGITGIGLGEIWDMYSDTDKDGRPDNTDPSLACYTDHRNVRDNNGIPDADELNNPVADSDYDGVPNFLDEFPLDSNQSSRNPNIENYRGF